MPISLAKVSIWHSVPGNSYSGVRVRAMTSCVPSSLFQALSLPLLPCLADNQPYRLHPRQDLHRGHHHMGRPKHHVNQPVGWPARSTTPLRVQAHPAFRQRHSLTCGLTLCVPLTQVAQRSKKHKDRGRRACRHVFISAGLHQLAGLVSLSLLCGYAHHTMTPPQVQRLPLCLESDQRLDQDAGLVAAGISNGGSVDV